MKLPYFFQRRKRRLGASGVEYALMVGLIGVTLILALTQTGTSIRCLLLEVGATMQNAAGNTATTPDCISKSDLAWQTGADLGVTSVSSSFSATLSATSSAGTVSYALASGQTLPTGLSLSGAGVLSGTPATGNVSGAQPIKVFSFTVIAADGTGATVSRTFSLTIQGVSDVAWSTAADLGNAPVSTAASYTLTATSSYAPISYSLASGQTLPSGLTLSSAGVLSGTPAASNVGATVTSQTYTMSIVATDAMGGTASRTFSLVLSGAPIWNNGGADPLVLTTATAGSSYSAALSVQAYNGVASYAVTTGTLPAGLSISSSSGTISGTPTLNSTGTAATTATVTVTATGSNGLTKTQNVKVPVTGKIIYDASGTFTPPSGISALTIKAWGASGGNWGGGGAFVKGTLANPSGQYTVTVGAAGGVAASYVGTASAAPNGGNTPSSGSNNTNPNIVGGGGGRSSFALGATYYLVAGAGGGGGVASAGGAGGYTTGQDGYTFGPRSTDQNSFTISSTDTCVGNGTCVNICGSTNVYWLPSMGGGATSSAGGTAGLPYNPGETCVLKAVVGDKLKGGTGGAFGNAGKTSVDVICNTANYGNSGGGGGDGWYGGGGGGGAASCAGGGGGGSSYINAALTSTSGEAGNMLTPGGSSDSDRGSAGAGKTSGLAGTAGRVVVSYGP